MFRVFRSLSVVIAAFVLLSMSRLAAATPTAPAPTPTSTASGVQEFPLSRFSKAYIAGSQVAAGAYRTPAWFSIPFTFELFQPTRGVGEVSSTGELFGLTEDTRFTREVVFMAVASQFSVDDAMTQLRATPKTDVTTNQPITVAGIAGTQFDMTSQQSAAQGNATAPAPMMDIPALSPLLGHHGDDWTTNTDARVRFIVLNIHERALLIYIEAPLNTWDDYLARVQQMLDTVQFDFADVSATPSLTVEPASMPQS